MLATMKYEIGRLPEEYLSGTAVGQVKACFQPSLISCFKRRKFASD